MQNPSFQKRDSGFGLTEVLISILVLTFGLLALAPLSGMVVNNNVLSGRITQATTLAQHQLEVYRRIPFNQLPALNTTLTDWINPNTLAVSSTNPGGGAFRRVTSILPVGSPAAANMRHIQVTVWWGNNAFSVPLNTMVCQ